MLFGLCSIDLVAQGLELKDGFYFKNNMLYTGTHIETYDNGQVKVEMEIKNGLKDGKVITFWMYILTVLDNYKFAYSPAAHIPPM